MKNLKKTLVDIRKLLFMKTCLVISPGRVLSFVLRCVTCDGKMGEVNDDFVK